MLTAADIRDVKFSKVLGGYKTEDVDVMLDKIEADYAAFERIIKEYELKNGSLEKEIESFKNSQSSIQNVLISAQRLADQMVNEAKEKSAEIITQAENSISIITAREKELSDTFDIKAQEKKNNLEKELELMVVNAQKKASSITMAAEQKVKEQQMLFDKLKLEIAAFKTGVTAKYKEHLELLSKLPDTIPEDPDYISKIMSTEFDKNGIRNTEVFEEVNPPEKNEEQVKEPAFSDDETSGFKVENIISEEDY